MEEQAKKKKKEEKEKEVLALTQSMGSLSLFGYGLKEIPFDKMKYT